jgi:hypothetical protein
LKAKNPSQPRARASERMSSRSTASAASQLATLFKRNGYLRHQNKSRLKKEGYVDYKKGEELRFSANSKAELALIRRLLQQLGFTPPRPFVKSNQFRQPIYSREVITQLLRFMRVR